MADIASVKGRGGLKPRREPYWGRIRSGCYLGFRKMAAGSHGTWIARWRDERLGRQSFRPLGDLSDYPDHQRYDNAKAVAEEWFKHLGAGGSAESFTVKDACERYVKHLREAGRLDAADDTDARFRRWVYSNEEFSRKDLSKLREFEVKDWRAMLKKTLVTIGKGESQRQNARSDSALNRDMTALRAAFNLALRDKLTVVDVWGRALSRVPNADRRREDYLDREQRGQLLSKAEGPLSTFIKGMCLLPLRPGALASLRVGDFDPALRTLKVGQDKAGNGRKIALPDATAAFLNKQRKGKPPTAPLLSNDSGGSWSKDQWKGPIKIAVAAAGLPPGVTCHTLRHSVITDLILAGLPTLTVARLSGTSVAMIEKHYGHLTENQARDALATLTI